ncbi:hypothetical protein DRE_03714 [Drechslerella stenobrocha 248]|uniref:Uncharacterized protein n=1 Tax=Drechslerella stenobrocha 248 TaxID=1043628 RepID=W7I3H2_9PEZI|nr:hypothetical protein DRE_03714 [Drechslerella stenobrocha 248]
MPGPAILPVVPDWLREGSAAYSLLSEPSQRNSFDNRKVARKLFRSQKRTVVLRETELFVAQGREIRCADLKDMKVATEKGEDLANGYQSLELPNLDFDIAQMIKSADGEAIIVVGEFDVGVALLPAPGVIAPGARSKISLKYCKLGLPTVTEKSRILRAIFHPLGARPCIVVLTEDAMLRIYEVEFNKEGSSVEPTESLDLKHMLGIERGSSYLIDDVDPASMCFGGVGSIWSMFTLYILMKNGEIFSICPFLPSKWMLDSDFMEELKYELQVNQEVRDSPDPSIPAIDKHNAKQICFWIHEVSRLIRVQNLASNHDDFEEDTTGYVLPKPTLPEFEAPLLQGPYLFQPAPEETFDDDVFASDIARIGAAQYAVIAIAWSTGKVDLMLEFEGVGPRWHSSSLKYKKFNERTHYPVISGYETIDITLPQATETSATVHPSLVVDINFPHILLLCHGFGVELLNLEDWMGRVSKVMDQEDDEHAIEGALNNAGGTSIIHAIGAQKGGPSGAIPVLGSSLIYDAYLGYLLITATTSKPCFVALQWPSKYHARMMKLKQERSDLSSTSSKPTPAISTQTSQLTDEDAVAAVQRRIEECRQRIQLLRQIIDPRMLASEVQISQEHISIMTRLRSLLFEEMDARYASAQQVHAAAVRQQQRFHEQISSIRKYSEQLAEREKQQQVLREKVDKTTETQAALKARVDAVLSKLSAISKKGGYSSMSQAEQDYVEEIHGIDKIVKQINLKQQKMTEFLETLGRSAVGSLEGQQVKASTEQETPDQNRQELSKMVQKEHKLILDIRKKVDYLEHQLQEVKLGA